MWWPISFLTRNAGIMAVDKEPILFPTSGCYERCRDTMYWMRKENIRPLATMEDPGIVEEEVKKKFIPAFEELGITKGKVGIDHVSMLTLMKLKEAFPKADFVNGDHCVLDAQVVKNSEEIKCMRVSSQMAAIAMDRAIREDRRRRQGMRDPGGGDALSVHKRDGGSPVQPDRDLGGRDRAAAAVCLGQEDQWGELVFLDLGGCFNGYFSDFTRTVIFGKPNEQHKKIYRAVYEMMNEIKRTLKPGNTNADVNRAARKVVIDHGFKGHDYLGLLGHSIGVTGLTYPIVGEIAASSEKEVVLKPGMIFSLEPGIFIPGIPGGGGVRLEDTLLVTEQGNEVLTTTPYDENLLS